MMKRLLFQSAVVFAMGGAALVSSPSVASAGGSCIYCVTECPPHPDLFCEAFNCPGGGAGCRKSACEYDDVIFPYTINCTAA